MPFSTAEILVQIGDMVKVGAVMVTIETDEKAADRANSEPEKAPAVANHPDIGINLPSPPTTGHETPVPASPATRLLARELGVDLRQVTPTGRGGVVTADDVRQFDTHALSNDDPSKTTTASAPQPIIGGPPISPELPDFTRWGTIARVPFRSIRRATAARMATAWSQIPHASSQDTVDVTRLETFRQAHKADIAAIGGKLSITVFVIKALAATLKAFPRFNASLDVDGQEIVLKHYYHIGVAVNTDSGLFVPVIRDVDRKSISEIAMEMKAMVEKTRTRDLSREELQGGTFTLTNAGAMGGGFFTPIINFPEVAILGTGQARMQPVVETDEKGAHYIVPRLMMPLVLCFDHRVADGAEAIDFLKHLMGLLGDPDALLMGI